MKKFFFLTALLCASMMMFADQATMKYTGTTTVNMVVDANNAEVVGLNADLFTVTADKGGNSNAPGLNKAGDMRLYADKNTGNGNKITVAITGGTIDKITIDYKQNKAHEVKAGDAVVTGTDGVFTINAASFSIQNVVTGASDQVQINSIVIDYTLGGGQGGDAIDWSKLEWLGNGSGNDAYTNKFKISVPEGVNVVNLQNSFGTEAGIYITLPAAPITACSLGEGKWAEQGAGMLLYLTAFTQKETEVTVTANGVDYKLVVYYEDGKEGGDDPHPVVTAAKARIFAYDLNVVADGDNYKFSYTANIDGTEANLVFYAEDGTEAGKVAIEAPKAGANEAVVAAKDLPAGTLTWAVELKAPAITELTTVFEAPADEYNKIHTAVDIYPESVGFGRIYMEVRNQAGATSGGAGGVTIYNPDYSVLKKMDKVGQPKWQSVGRPAVGEDGTVYLSDWGDSHGGIYIMDPTTLIADTFFVGTQDANGVWTNAEGVPMGSSTASVGVYGSGAKTLLYAMNEDVAKKDDVELFAHGVNIYQIGQEDGTLLKKWDKAPTKTFALKDNAAQMFVINANEHGAFFSCSRGEGNNAAGARSLQFYTNDGQQAFVALPEGETADLTASLGGGCAVSPDLKTLAIIGGSKNILVYDITWNVDTPSLKLNAKYATDFAAFGSLSFDYAGNIVATVGGNYANSAANHLIVYGVPTDNNVTVVPAKKALTVEGPALVDNGPIIETYFALPGWVAETDSKAEWDAENKLVKVSIANDKNSQWFAQVKLKDEFEYKADKYYDFALPFKANKAVNNVTIKIHDNNGMVDVKNVALPENEDYVWEMKNVKGRADGNGVFVLDFGYATAGTEIIVDWGNFVITEKDEKDPEPQIELKTGQELYNVPGASLSSTWFASSDWKQETESSATFNEQTGDVTVNIAVDKSSQWQAQVKIATGAVFAAENQYQLVVKMKANADINGVTVKLQDADDYMYLNNSVSLEANEEMMLVAQDLQGKVGNDLLIFDFGFAKAGNVIEIYDISIICQDCPEGTGLDNIEKENILRKYIEDGVIFIEANGEVYTVTGVKVK